MFRANWHLYVYVSVCACVWVLAPGERAAAVTVGLLDGSSVQSTFNGTSGQDNNISDTLIGYTDVVGTGRVWQDTTDGGAVNGVLIHTSPGATSAFTSAYDTQVALQPDTRYDLIVDLGFAGTSTNGTATSTVSLGTFSGGTFTASASDASKTVTQPASGWMYNNVYAGRSHVTFTTGGSVAAGATLGVSLANLGNSTASWFGFDNPILWATPSNAAYVGNLDGTSVQSTFYNGSGSVNTTTLPSGWINATGTARVFGDGTASHGYGIISNGTSTSNFSVLYDTQTAIQANTEYLLTTDLGFYTGGGSGHISGNFTLELGTWDGSNFTPLASNSGAVNYYAYGFGTDASGSTALNLTTGAGVSGDLAVRLSRTGGTVNWQGFDNVVLTAASIPEPGTLALLAAGVAGLLCYAWRKRR